MTFYIAAKWRTSRLVKLNFRLAIVLGLTFGMARLGLDYLPVPPWIRLIGQMPAVRVFFLFGSAAIIVTFWSHIHIGRQRLSLHLFVESSDLLSFHWTPQPEWVSKSVTQWWAQTGRGVPRRAILLQFKEWVSLAQRYGFRHVKLESPLLVSSNSDGSLALPASIRLLAERVALMPGVESVIYTPPRPLSRTHTLGYRLIWPSAARKACISESGRIIVAGLVAHLARE